MLSSERMVFIMFRCSALAAVPTRASTNLLKCVRWNSVERKRQSAIVIDKSRRTLMESDCRFEVSSPSRFLSPTKRPGFPTTRRHFSMTTSTFFSSSNNKRTPFHHWPTRKFSSAKPDYYEKLGVQSTATPTEIKHAYYRAAKACHPDLFPDDPKAAAKFRDVRKQNTK